MPGRQTGHVAGFGWDDLVAGLVAERGSLSAVAMHLAAHRDFAEDAQSVERGLRRLRSRGSADGGVWGARVLRCFGLPRSVSQRVRWMGQYHTRFTDLPASLCEELLRPWDRPPISESPARIWIHLARTSLALRARRDPGPALKQAAMARHGAEPAARAELALVEAYAFTRDDPELGRRALADARVFLDEDGLDADDRACLFARWVDQAAYPLNRPREGPPDHEAALALYLQIPADGPAFATCRRENGLGWTRHKLGQRAAALEHARASVEAAGDVGSLRMRAMALNLLATVADGELARDARRRARAIADRLEDEALRARFDP